MVPAGRAGFPIGLLPRTLLIGIHGLGSFHVWQNNGIPNLDAFFNKLAAKAAQTNDQGPRTVTLPLFLWVGCRDCRVAGKHAACATAMSNSAKWKFRLREFRCRPKKSFGHNRYEPNNRTSRFLMSGSPKLTRIETESRFATPKARHNFGSSHTTIVLTQRVFWRNPLALAPRIRR